MLFQDFTDHADNIGPLGAKWKAHKNSDTMSHISLRTETTERSERIERFLWFLALILNTLHKPMLITSRECMGWMLV